MMISVLDVPMIAYRGSGGLGQRHHRASVVGGFTAKCPLAGLGDAQECLTFDANNGRDVLIPFTALKSVPDGKDIDRACLGAGMSWRIVYRDGAFRGESCGDSRSGFEQSRLISFDLRDQCALGVTSSREGLFLAIHGIGRGELPRQPEFGKQALGCRDLIALVVDLQMAKDDGGIGGEGAQDLDNLLVVEIVKDSP